MTLKIAQNEAWARQELIPLDHAPELAQLTQPPTKIQLWGRLPCGPRVALVGTRTPSTSGERIAFELARDLAQQGICIVSGGAVGIDAAAHRGALAGGGQTLVIAPLWLDSAYPKEHRPLFDEILSRDGGYLSVAEPDAQPFNWVFFRRNEVLAALSDLIILGDCPVRSGARNAMHHARRLGRPRFCLPGPFGRPESQGGFLESRELGASWLFNEDALWEELALLQHRGGLRFLEALRARARSDGGRRKRRPPKSNASASAGAKVSSQLPTLPASFTLPTSFTLPAELGSEGKRVLQAVAQAHGTPDAIALEAGLEIAVVQHQIALLTLHGLVFQDESGVLRYQAATHD